MLAAPAAFTFRLARPAAVTLVEARKRRDEAKVQLAANDPKIENKTSHGERAVCTHPEGLRRALVSTEK